MSDDPAITTVDREWALSHGALIGAGGTIRGCECGWRSVWKTGNEYVLHVVEAARPIIEAEYQNRMVELTKAPITAADLSELTINDLTDAERDAFVAALTEGRTSEDRAALAAQVRAKVLVERSSLGTPEAHRLRESVPDEVAREVVRRAAQLGDPLPGHQCSTGTCGCDEAADNCSCRVADNVDDPGYSVVLNPSAIGNPDETPIVRLPRSMRVVLPNYPADNGEPE